MKKLLLIVLVLFFTLLSFGQDDTVDTSKTKEIKKCDSVKDGSISIELDSVFKYGKYSYVFKKTDLPIIFYYKNLKFNFIFNGDTIDDSCTNIKRRYWVSEIEPNKIRKILLKKNEKSFRIFHDGEKIGILTIRKSGNDFLLPAKSSNNSKNPSKNTTIILNNCDKTISIKSPEEKPRKNFFIKQSELVNFEIENINPLRDVYKINNEFISLNQTIPDTIINLVEEDKEKLIEKSVNDNRICDEMEGIIKLDEEISRYLYKVSLNSCPNYKQINDTIKGFINKIPKYNKYIGIDTLSCKIYFETDTANKKIIGLSEKMRETVSNIHENLKTLLRFQDNKITTLPLSVAGKNIDLIRYNIEYSTVDEDKKPVFTNNISYDVYIRHGIKIDYSAGVFVSLHTNEKYRLKDTLVITDTLNNTSTHKQILRDNEDWGNLSIGTTVNLIYRCGATFNPGLSFGVMLPINSENLSPHFIGGFSGIFGKEQRLGLSVGFVYGQTNKLTSGYEENRVYDLKDTGVPYTPSYSWGWYFGLVYNLKGNKVFDFKN